MEKVNEAMVREIVTRVLNEMLMSEGFVKEKDSSGILKVKTDTVKCEPFSDTPGVYLKDIVSLEEAPRMEFLIIDRQLVIRIINGNGDIGKT